MRSAGLHPVFYHARIEQKRPFRALANVKDRKQFAEKKEESTCLSACKRINRHCRELGSSDSRLQENINVNLTNSAKAIVGILIEPGEVFSFWRLVGRATKRKGYIEGMQLSRGEVKTVLGAEFANSPTCCIGWLFIRPL